MSGLRWVALALTVGLVGCTPLGQEPGARGPDDRPAAVTTLAPGQLTLASALQPFDACEELLAYAQEHALERVGPYGLGSGGGSFEDVVDSAAEAAAAEEGVDDGRAADEAAAGTDASGAQQGIDFSGTNVQEGGVDEPDIVKTDGATVWALARNELQVIDVTGAEPALAATMELTSGWDHRLLLDGDRLLILANTDRGSATPLPQATTMGADIIGPAWSQFTELTLVDVADPADPTVLETVLLDGRNLSARLSDGALRVVVRSEPNGLAFVTPQGSGLRAEQEATEANRDIIRSSTADNWIPYFVRTSADGTRSEGSLVDCERVSRPEEFSGLGTITVLSLDLADGLDPEGATGVFAGGETVYATAERLYVATNQWADPIPLQRGVLPEDSDYTTELHAFDISDPATANYMASGEVPGHLLSQWSLSHHEGHLRVATTRGDPWSATDTSESLVTVLAERDGELAQVGQVGGLGRGERIYAVRFIDDIGYVVTFRQTDPLYTIDLTDPTAPTVRGELKILGYSAYLHPVGDGLLLGVGQDATEDGVVKGTQLSLFDVADLGNPQRIAQTTFADGTSEVEYDHHAFLWWQPTGLAVVPVHSWRWDEATGTEHVDSGAVAFSASRGDGLRERARLSHIPETLDPADPARWDLAWQGQIRRSLVVGERLYTLSELGLGAHDLDTLVPAGFLGFDA